jgi:histidinol dehydrogenase
MNRIINPEKSAWSQILERPVLDIKPLMKDVEGILENVKLNGDKALREYCLKFDKVKLDELKVSKVERKMAKHEVSASLSKAIDVARRNIELFHRSQTPSIVIRETTPGVKCWLKSIPIQKVGLYIPGGTAPLISTVLMLGVPATIAGCQEIVLCTPPNKDGKIDSAILYAADLLGIKNIYKVGGAQAIAAMAYGTESVPKVYKIFGPGNQYVTAAKLKVSLENVAIDMPAGPSELAVIADDTCIPEFIASDLLSQAEHGIDSQVILVSKSESLLDKVEVALEEQLKNLPRKAIAEQSLAKSKMILLENDEAIMELINEYAPEHLIIMSENFNELAEKVINAGSVFLGKYSAESAGDYATGTNHTLPTNGMAKAYSGIGTSSFMKRLSFQQLSSYGLFNIGNTIEELAMAEDLFAHKNAISIRLKEFKRQHNDEF